MSSGRYRIWPKATNRALRDSDYIAGQLLAVDGGYLAQGLSS